MNGTRPASEHPATAEGAADEEIRSGDVAWEGMFRQLVQYHTRHGHCFVPLRCREQPKLGAWLAEQGRLFRKRRLSVPRQHALEGLGFDWETEESRARAKDHEERWEGRYAELAAFKAKHGHLRMTLKNQTSPGFKHWRDNQRLNFREGRLSPERKARLDALGFEWQAPGRTNAPMADQYEDLWEKRFGQLVAFQHEHGHCQVPAKWRVNPALGKWVLLQRKLHKSGQLRQDRAERLEQIGFAWKSDNNHHTVGWERRFVELVAFKERFGHLRVTKSNQTSPGFKHWRDNQRLNFREGRLRPEWKARLEALGFEWETPGRLAMPMAEQHAALWERMFEQLLAYREQHGHCQVPAKWRVNPALGKWVLRQRGHNNRSDLPRDRKERLEQIGFAWKSDNLLYAQGWEERFAELVAFKEQHGHLRVTMTNQTSPGLNHWRDNQRIHFRIGTLTPERKARLDALGFVWEAQQDPAFMQIGQNEVQWEKRLAELLAFRARHGHCTVPKRWPENPALAGWVCKQRGSLVRGQLRQDRKERLEEIGFANDSPLAQKQEAWERRYAELVAFKAQQGHLQVSRHSPAHGRLAYWLHDQRRYYRKGSLSQDRKALLNALGIDWQPARPRPARTKKTDPLPKDSLSLWEWYYDRLLEFKQQHGHANVPASWPEDQALADWVREQCEGRIYGRLHFGQLARLEALGFAW